MTKQFARENNLTETARYRKILSEERQFYQRCVTYSINASTQGRRDQILDIYSYT